MSTSHSSKPGSQAAQAIREARDLSEPVADRPRADSGRVEIELEVSRGRWMSWTLGGGAIGGLLIWKLGTLGVWGGVVLVAIAAHHAWRLLQTFLYPPGTIVVSDHEISLPRGPYKPRPVMARRSDITAAYVLRKSVPWNRVPPVLIVELGATAMVFPRDWFTSEADQRRVIDALSRDRPAPVRPPTVDAR